MLRIKETISGQEFRSLIRIFDLKQRFGAVFFLTKTLFQFDQRKKWLELPPQNAFFDRFLQPINRSKRI